MHSGHARVDGGMREGTGREELVRVLFIATFEGGREGWLCDGEDDGGGDWGVVIRCNDGDIMVVI